MSQRLFEAKRLLAQRNTKQTVLIRGRRLYETRLVFEEIHVAYVYTCTLYVDVYVDIFYSRKYVCT